MNNHKNVAIIGTEGIGKTTLANALLGWDILPQSNDEIYVPTTENASQMLTETIQLTDTPGYDYWWNTLPDDVIEAVSEATTIIVLLDNMLLTEEDTLPVEPEWEEDMAVAEKEWKEDQAAQKAFVEKLLKKSKTKDVFFVIPYDMGELEDECYSLNDSLSLAREYYSSMTSHGDAGFFCIDPMKALIAAIEDDKAALEASGILPLKAALLGGEE